MPKIKAKILRWLLFLSAVLFVTGISLPMITITKLVLISHSFSIVSGAYELLNEGRVILFLVIALFSVVLPMMKIFVLYKILSAKTYTSLRAKRYLHLMHEYGRWAMLDVMVVAILIVTVKLGAIVTIQVHYGLYLFGASVLLIMVITNSVIRLTR